MATDPQSLALVLLTSVLKMQVEVASVERLVSTPPRKNIPYTKKTRPALYVGSAQLLICVWYDSCLSAAWIGSTRGFHLPEQLLPSVAALKVNDHENPEIPTFNRPRLLINPAARDSKTRRVAFPGERSRAPGLGD